MGIRERLAKANWELNMFLRTGRFPKTGYSLQPTANSYSSPYPPRATANRYNNHIGFQQVPNEVPLQAAKTRCGKCGSEVSIMAAYCHVCGFKLK